MAYHLLSTGTLFQFYLRFFQLLGLCPVVFNHSNKFNFKILILISFVHIILLTVVVICVYTYGRYIFFNDGEFGQFNDTILYVVIIVADYAIIIESFLKRETQSRIWNLLARSHRVNRLDEIDQWKLWNVRQYNKYFCGLYSIILLNIFIPELKPNQFC